MRMVLENGVLRPKVAEGRVIVGRSKGPKTKNLDDYRALVSNETLNICVYRSLGGIGDILMATPSFRAIKSEWPSCHLTVATDFKYANGGLRDILQNNPYIDEIIAYQVSNARQFDILVDITSVCIARERQGGDIPNRIDIFADAIGISLENTGHRPDIFFTEQEKAFAKEALAQTRLTAKGKPLVCICPRSSTAARTWPIDKTRELVGMLTRDDRVQVCIIDQDFIGSGEKELWNMPKVKPLINFPIRQMSAFINEMDLVVAPDTGTLHVAGAFDKKIVAIFAGTNPNARINYYPNAVAVAKKEFACFPCWYSPQACRGKYTCLNNITPQLVLDTIYSKLDEPLKTEQLPELNSASQTIVLKRSTGGYGDIMCMECAAKVIKERKPESEIVIATPPEYHVLFENNPVISKCLSLEDSIGIKSRFVFDLTKVDAQTEFYLIKTGVKTTPTRPEMYIRRAGISDYVRTELTPRLYIKPGDLEWVDPFISRESEKKYIATVLRSAEDYRTWPLANYLQLFDLASKRPDLVFLLLDSQRFIDKLPPNVRDCTGLDIRQMIHILAKSDCVLSPDTSAVHFAAALDKPCLSMFGPIDYSSRVMYYRKNIAITAGLDCIPCWRNCKIKCKKGGVGGFSQCMIDLSAESVLKELEQMLSRTWDT